MKNTWIVKRGDQWWVAPFQSTHVWANRSYFAWRFSSAAKARDFVRNNLRDWRSGIDSIYVVRLKRRQRSNPPVSP